MPTPSTVDIVAFRDDLAPAFGALNRAWLSAGGLLEPPDEPYLADPRGTIVTPGGEVFFAIEHGVVIGTAAALPFGVSDFELAKVHVVPAAKGRGLGRSLVMAVLDFARARGASRVVLSSNSNLTVALALYRSLGFVHSADYGGTSYETADVFMELDLRAGSA